MDLRYWLQQASQQNEERPRPCQQMRYKKNISSNQVMLCTLQLMEKSQVGSLLTTTINIHKSKRPKNSKNLCRDESGNLRQRKTQNIEIYDLAAYVKVILLLYPELRKRG